MMLNENRLKIERNLDVYGIIRVSAITREMLIKTLFDLPTSQMNATVELVGIPAVISAHDDPQYRVMYESATLAVLDGMPLVKLARKRGIKCDRCSGPDIMGKVFEEGIKRGAKHFFYGGKNDEVLKNLRNNLERDYPGIQIVGMYSPPFRPLTEDEDKQVCKLITDCNPDFIWVGIGAPKQEMWMWEHQKKLYGSVMLGVGAAFDFLAGSLAKAPKWMEDAGVEWLYRLIKEPKRLWRRYIIGGF